MASAAWRLDAIPGPPGLTRFAGDTGERGGDAPFCGESGGVVAALKSAWAEDGDSGDCDVGVDGSMGACSGRPAFASSRRFSTCDDRIG